MPDQIRLSNGHLSIGLNRRTGAWVELVDEMTGENLIKNRQDAFRSLLRIQLANEPKWATLPDPDLDHFTSPTIRVDGLKMSCELPVLYMDEKPVKASAIICLELAPDAPEVQLSARIHSESPLEKVLFPCLSGVYLGGDPSDNVLVTPFSGGERIPDPITTIASAHPGVQWRWQDYRWRHALSGPAGRHEADGRWVHEASFAGGCSALFCDLYNADGGLSFACNDATHGVCTLRLDTFGPLSPGLNFSFAHPARGNAWQSPSCTVAVHEGDWHYAVNRWRGQRSDAPNSPKWFSQSAGLVTHYDFQYQNGDIIHRFADLAQLYEQTKALGLNNIMLAGWHEGGFDRGFPCYHANELLGGEQTLKGAVERIRRDGGHVTFYVNTRLCNTAYPAFARLIDEAAERDEQGEPLLEQYGSDGLTFACMCPQSQAWQDVIVDAAKYLVHTIGADGLYLDQLACASPKLCRGGHGALDGWNRGYREMLRRIREAVGPETALIVQGVAQSVGGMADGMLTTSVSHLENGGFPTFYRYLHPEQTLVEMLPPRKFSGFWPEAVARRSTDVMERAFLLGLHAWIYDLEGDNTFRLDPEQHERLRRMLRLRSAWLHAYGQGIYRDHDGVEAYGLNASRFDLESGDVLLALVNHRSGDQKLQLAHAGACGAFVRTIDEPEEEKPLCFDVVEGHVQLTIPDAEMALIRIQTSTGGERR